MGKKTFLKWVQLILLEVKSNFSKFTFKILRVFLIVFRINYLGLIILIPQVFLNNLSVSIIGDLMSPSLSLLLSNIEVLTHLFRPITLTAHPHAHAHAHAHTHTDTQTYRQTDRDR